MKLRTSPETKNKANKDLDQIAQLIKESTAQTPLYDPFSLRHFNPAALLHFKSEIPSMLVAEHVREGSQFDHYNTTPEQFMVMNLQVYEYYKAMQFAEETIMPQFTLNNLKNITPEMIVDWIRHIHRLCANKLFLAEGNRQSGEYANDLVLRWHAGTQWQMNLFKTWFHSKHDKKKNDPALMKQLNSIGLDKS